MLQFARWKIAVILLLLLTSSYYAAPNLLGDSLLARLPDWMPKQKINLGLDLQGGSHLLLEVDVQAVINERLQSLTEEVRTALRKQRIGYKKLGIRDGALQVEIREPGQFESARELIKELNGGGVVVLGMIGGAAPELEISTAGDQIEVRLSDDALARRKTSAVQQSIEIVRRRIDELGNRESTIQRQGEDRILVQVPGLDNPAHLKAMLGKTAKLSFRLLDQTISPAEAKAGRMPIGSEILPSDEPGSPEFVVRKQVMVSGANLVDAQPSTDSQTNEPVVLFRFDSVGGKLFADVTKVNIGKPFAIVLDGRVVSAPVIRSAILGGSGQISGNFTYQEANDLSILLRAGALPAPLLIIEERTVGAELGADSVNTGRNAAIIGFLAVAAYMVLSYGLFGLFANLSLVMNIILISAALTLLQSTLTLPGIAGIVLTMGMAVDANVLIYERIREELANGKSPISAVQAGFDRAYGTILDANITTFIAAAIMFQVGSGPVRGFAVTLMIGVVTSVYTAVTVTKFIITQYLRRVRPASIVV
ncbi:MAG: preprotein translocase subunit SecD [Alphaproteobacteria bacterium]|nr:preprotein translocase subunit SecD [Alphaproteobacteria bacterium]